MNRRLLSEANAVRRLLALAIGASLLGGLLLILQAYLLSAAIDRVFLKGDTLEGAAPLLLALGWVVDARPGRTRRLIAFAAPFALTLALLLAWDGLRGQASGVWALAAANNAPWRWLRSDEVWPRLEKWGEYGGWLLGLPAVTFVLGGLGVGLALRRAWQPPRRGSAVDLVLLAFGLAYLGLHWLAAFNLYDRYLLPLLAPLALATAQQTGASPQAALMVVAVAASMAFVTPIASPVNTLVMTAGNYRFTDYMRLGLLMLILSFVVTMLLLPLLWPL